MLRMLGERFPGYIKSGILADHHFPPAAVESYPRLHHHCVAAAFRARVLLHLQPADDTPSVEQAIVQLVSASTVVLLALKVPGGHELSGVVAISLDHRRSACCAL